jgi:uncharacterized metal-binding protein YceD (DUF177 family)
MEGCLDMTALTMRLAEIPEAGLIIDEAAPTAWLENVLGVTEDATYRPLTPLQMNLKVTKLNKRVSVNGRVRLTVAFTCSRCTRDSEQELNVKIKETFLPAEKFVVPGKKNIDLDQSDFRFAYYENDELDLGAYIAESILLELPMYPVCADSDACVSDAVVWREDWDEEAEHEKEINPAWQAQLAMVKDELADVLEEEATPKPKKRKAPRK